MKTHYLASFCSSLHHHFPLILRYLFNQHSEDRGGQPRPPQTLLQGADQLQQEKESGGNHRRDPAVPEPALLPEAGARNQGGCSHIFVILTCVINHAEPGL